MEVLLNTIWLVITIGAFLYWGPKAYIGASMNRSPKGLLGTLALSCALVLLFPVISLTDDLHAEQAPMEDSSRAVIKARNMVQGCLRAGNSSRMAVVTHAPFSVAALHFFLGAALLNETRAHFQILISHREGRSPPSHL